MDDVHHTKKYFFSLIKSTNLHAYNLLVRNVELYGTIFQPKLSRKNIFDNQSHYDKNQPVALGARERACWPWESYFLPCSLSDEREGCTRQVVYGGVVARSVHFRCIVFATAQI